jgi:hypothetical protein
MPFSRIAYIGQRRIGGSSGLAGYGLGDAQIDAQNRVVQDIQTPYLDRYNATKGTPGFTQDFILQTINGIQQLVTNYAHQYASTSRGEAGRVTLQTFIDQKLFPAMRADFAAAQGASASPSTVAVPNQNQFGVNPFDGSPNAQPVNVNINTGGTTDATAGNIQPSQSPGAPSGIQIPGSETTVTAAPLQWYENPAMLALIGLGVFVLIGAGKQRS